MNLDFSGYEPNGNCENFDYCSPSWCFYLFILPGPSRGLRHPEPAQRQYDEKLADLMGH